MATWTNLPDDVFASWLAILEQWRTNEDEEQRTWTETLASATLVCRNWRRGVSMHVQRLTPRCSFELLPLITTRFPNLRVLDLKKCQPRSADFVSRDAVADFPSESLAVFSRLRSLCQCHRLKQLEIRHINDHAMQLLSNLTRLECLHIGGYLTISSEGIAHLSSLQKLTSLKFDGDGMLRSKDYAFLTNLHNLQRLSLHNCRMDDAGLSFLSTMHSLTDLNLSSCREINGIGLSALQSLSQLISLNLASTSITEDSLKQLIPCINLRSLNISFCQCLKPNGLVHGIGSLPLAQLQLIRCDSLTLESVLELKSKLKACQIIFQKAGDVFQEKYYAL